MENKKLELEKATFEKHLAEWQISKLGEFVLIKGTDVVGFYPSLEEAFNEGLNKFGIEDFFVEQIIPPGATNISFLGVAI